MRLLRFGTWAVLLAAFVLTAAGIPAGGAPGYDESSHGFEALRMAQAVRDLDPARLFDWFLAPDLYPPLGRLGLALGFLFGGDGWSAPRFASAVAWAVVLWLATRLARRMVEPERRDAAAFFTAVFGAMCSLGVSFARSAYLEPWGALAIALASLALLRACETRRTFAFVVAGLLCGACFLVKYNYGLFAAAAAVGFFAWGWLGRWIPGERAEARVDARGVAGWTAGVAIVLAWWFVWPIPAGRWQGDAHREFFKIFATISNDVAGWGPETLALAWPLQACISIPSFLAQIAGIAWGIAPCRRPASRLCVLVALAGPGAYIAYSHREFRFLIPCLFASWALGGALVADLLERVAPPRRLLAAALALAVLVLTAGLGTPTVFAWVRGEAPTPGQLEAIRPWSRPYAFDRVPSGGPPFVEATLDLAVRHLDPERPYAWIGGTVREFSLQGTRWRMYQATRAPLLLDLKISGEETFMDEPHWSEDEFRAWIAAFPQVVTVDAPGVARREGRERDARYTRWMASHPSYRVKARESLTRENDEPMTVTFYELAH